MNDRTTLLIDQEDERSPLLDEFGERLRTLRARRGMSRKQLSLSSRVSERYLANLEFGKANPSLGVLDQVSRGLGCSVAELLGDSTTLSPEWLLIRDILGGRSEADLRRARVALSQVLGVGSKGTAGGMRIALIGLRGAGKSTLGGLLSEHLEVPFIELSAHIEALAGYSIREIHDLCGVGAYRRYERRALEEALQIHPEFVMATPGGVVSDATTFGLLLDHCFSVWLRAAPEDHMSRVAQQGDLRPMAGNAEAMEDLRRILEGREAFYAKADVTVDTSCQPLDETFGRLRTAVQDRFKA